MNFKFIDDLEKFLGGNVKIESELCPENMDGDLTINAFKFAKNLGKNPMQLAQEICDFLKQNKDVEKAESIKAFINITLKPQSLFRDTISSGRIIEKCEISATKKKNLLVEFSAPNTNKPQHLGHVRNNVLGQSSCSILRKVGHNITSVNLINDRGIHICKSMLAYQRFGNNITPIEFGKKGDHLVGHFYVRYNQELKKELAELRIEKPDLAMRSDEDLFLETDIGKETQNMLQKWESNDTEIRELWLKMNNWVFAGFDETYAKLGIEFDKVFLESNTYILGKDIIEDGLRKGVFYKRDDGAIEIDLEDVKLGKKVVLRSDGTSVYITQDIGTTVLKADEFKPDGQIWVVGDEQKYHFQVLFEILKRLGYKWAENLYHLAYGMVNLPSGKMKSREGTVVDADDLLAEMCELAREATITRCNGKIPDDIEKRARVIGIGALKFMLLKVNPKTTMIFDPNESLKFEGDTAPYVQYAYARIASIIRKAKEQNIPEHCGEFCLLQEKSEKELALLCALYPSIIQNAAEKLDASQIATFLLNLAKAFSRFYANCPVLNSENTALVSERIDLCQITSEILKDGLNTLTIDVLETM